MKGSREQREQAIPLEKPFSMSTKSSNEKTAQYARKIANMNRDRNSNK